MADTNLDDLLEKLRRLPAERVSEVEDFVDFLDQRDARRAARAAVGRLRGQAQERGLGALSESDIQAEIAAARRPSGK